MEDELLTVEQVAEKLKAAESTVYGLIKRRKNPLPHLKLGKKMVRVPASDFKEWVGNHKVK